MSTPFCWHCGGTFPPNALDENAKYVADPFGYWHRVHQVCFEDALATVMSLTAQEPQPAAKEGT